MEVVGAASYAADMVTANTRTNRALLVVDVQHEVVDEAHDRDAVVARIVDLVGRARAADVPVVWVQHHDEGLERHTPEWEWLDGLGPRDGERLVEKEFGDSFAGTDLDTVLTDLDVGRFTLVGAASEQCIRCTLHGGVIRGYDVDLVQGAHTTTDLTAYGLPDPATVIAFVDSIAQFGMQWPDARGASVAPDDVGF